MTQGFYNQRFILTALALLAANRVTACMSAWSKEPGSLVVKVEGSWPEPLEVVVLNLIPARSGMVQYLGIKPTSGAEAAMIL